MANTALSTPRHEKGGPMPVSEIVACTSLQGVRRATFITEGEVSQTGRGVKGVP